MLRNVVPGHPSSQSSHTHPRLRRQVKQSIKMLTRIASGLLLWAYTHAHAHGCEQPFYIQISKTKEAIPSSIIVPIAHFPRPNSLVLDRIEALTTRFATPVEVVLETSASQSTSSSIQHKNYDDIPLERRDEFRDEIIKAGIAEQIKLPREHIELAPLELLWSSATRMCLSNNNIDISQTTDKAIRQLAERIGARISHIETSDEMIQSLDLLTAEQLADATISQIRHCKETLSIAREATANARDLTTLQKIQKKYRAHKANSLTKTESYRQRDERIRQRVMDRVQSAIPQIIFVGMDHVPVQQLLELAKQQNLKVEARCSTKS